MKKSKLFSSLGIALLASVTISAGVSADTDEGEQLTEQHEINWEDAWSNQKNLDASVEFGNSSETNGDGMARASSWGSLSTGKTDVSSNIITDKVSSTGTSKGKVYTTTTSATTSLRDVDTGYTVNGDKSIALAKFTAESSAEMSAASLNVYSGLTIHTATDSGVLYEARTGDSVVHY
ncbi:hypothetical protein SAMN05192559_10821 [Halobacillus karajensis]|uniref:Uncharacterized protein n=1 Tax=Halobacillus karajensis TaxID=195088 RepID=A0A024P4M1_9BACI|nr:hypothetical protein [Halobacillus karajensis]CDQ20842.1 hypothetical protein BN982_03197 [Halobacillus karajensis]CDQ23688.1 hypothetical protein BN983_01939 [Halobacillus karajensis]CDQ27166.1 hypothetical protein BN981_01420 [Halobacillus karajensis]SEI03795.1 hypothetical protein SAMN05192559_10821 [Halobacillus karajensis]